MLRFSFLRAACVAVVLLAVPAFGQPTGYLFTTIAGLAGETGSKDGLGTEARFNSPSGLAVDKLGNLYVAELQNNTIRKLSPAGQDWVVTTICGTPGVRGSADGTNQAATFNHPRGLAVDPAGNLYVADTLNRIIRKAAPQGTDWSVTTIAGTAGVSGEADGLGPDAQFATPVGVAFEPASGAVFVSDATSSTIRRLAQEGDAWNVTTIAGFPGDFDFVDGFGADASFAGPYFLAADLSTNIVVADLGNHAIRSIAPGPDWQVATITGFSGESGSLDGSAAEAQFYFPSGVAIDAQGAIYVADQDNNAIRKIAPENAGRTVTTIGGNPKSPAGSADGLGMQALFRKPWGIAVDPNGVIYIADFGNHTIRKGTPPSAPAPSLQYELLANELILSWPAEAEAYRLESSPEVGNPGQWQPITNGIVLTGRSFVYTNKTDLPATFFRLHQF